MYHRVIEEENSKLKMSNHVERKYMIVVVFDCKMSIRHRVELTLNVSETERLPDGWEEFFDPLLAATVNQTLPVLNFGMRSDRIITYNLCFGCMSEI
jgi:hypothetical protein